MLHFTLIPMLSLLLLCTQIRTIQATRNVWPQKLRLPSTTNIRKLSLSEFTYRLHSRQNIYTETQVVDDICNANPQDNFSDCYNSVAPQIQTSADSYCGTKWYQWRQCTASYPGDNGLSECTPQEQAYNECSTFTYQMYEYCLTYGYSTIDSVGTCANVELQVRITSSATVVAPTATATISSSSTAAAAPVQTGVRVSPSGACGTDTSGIWTCRGSAFGSCCSGAGMCGSNATSCGEGCQPVFGLCDVLSSTSSTPIPASDTSTPLTNPGTTISTTPLTSISFTYIMNKTTSAPPIPAISISIAPNSIPLAPGPVLISTLSTSTFSPHFSGAGRNGTALSMTNLVPPHLTASGVHLASLTSQGAVSSLAAGTVPSDVPNQSVGVAGAGSRVGSGNGPAVETGTAVGAGRNPVCVRRTRVVRMR